MTYGYRAPVREHCALTEQVYCKEITDPKRKAAIEHYLTTVKRVPSASETGINPDPPKSRYEERCEYPFSQ